MPALPAVAAAALLVAAAPSGPAPADAQRGAQIFNRCKVCHSLAAGQNRVGPSLYGLFGRKAGTVPGYDYSAAMRQAGVTWDEQTLARYLADPNKFVPGDKMAFPGIKDPGALADLIAYLKQAPR
jgi:cytochrome c2